jgi:nitroreductase
MDVIEAMETCSAARYLKRDPVPQDLIERLIYAATRASSPGNSQEWDFIVVRNPEAKQKIRDLLAPRFNAMMGGAGSTTGRVTSRMLAGAMHLAETLNEVPAIIFVCGPVAYPPNAPMEQFVWSALYPRRRT